MIHSRTVTPVRFPTRVWKGFVYMHSLEESIEGLLSPPKCDTKEIPYTSTEKESAYIHSLEESVTHQLELEGL